MNDPVVEEVRRIREEYAAECDYDLQRIYEDIKRIERESGRPHVSFEPNRVDAAPARVKS